MRTVNIGMIGGGFMGKAHSVAYACMPMFFWPPPAIPVRRVVADVDSATAAEAARRYGFDRSTNDWHDVIDDPEVEVVDIATPNDTHAAIAIAAAAAGKHILCEKPLARNADETAAMTAAVDEAGVINLVAFNYRRTPAVALARLFIDEGRIGDLLDLRVTNLQDGFADPSSPLSWRFQREVAGSGALGDIGSHALDIAQYLAGDIVAVSGIAQTYVAQRPVLSTESSPTPSSLPASLAPVDVDDQALALLRFRSGVVGTLEATRNAHGRHNYLTFEVHGTRGTISFNYERRDELQVFFASDPVDQRGFRTIYTGPEHPYGHGLWPIPALGVGFTETKIIECYDLMRAVADGSPIAPTFQDGHRIARVIDALLTSSDTGQWIDVP